MQCAHLIPRRLNQPQRHHQPRNQPSQHRESVKVTDWKIAMICLLPMMLGGAKLRTWGALFGASLAALFAPFIAAFVAIDIVAAAVILRQPLGIAQRLIGLLFVGMVFFELGFLISEGHQQELMLSGLAGLGWAQWVILAAWGLYDTWGYCSSRFGPSRRSLPVAGRVQ